MYALQMQRYLYTWTTCRRLKQTHEYNAWISSRSLPSSLSDIHVRTCVPERAAITRRVSVNWSDKQKTKPLRRLRGSKHGSLMPCSSVAQYGISAKHSLRPNYTTKSVIWGVLLFEAVLCFLTVVTDISTAWQHALCCPLSESQLIHSFCCCCSSQVSCCLSRMKHMCLSQHAVRQHLAKPGTKISTDAANTAHAQSHLLIPKHQSTLRYD